MANEVPVGITLPYTRGEVDGFFKQTHSLLERARTNLSFLLMTAKGERPMMPEYGSDLRSIIFNPNTQDFLDEIIEDTVKENVDGKFYVDHQCIDCDLCRENAPNNFKRQEDEGYSFVYKQPETDQELEDCNVAMEGCPVEAIGNDR